MKTILSIEFHGTGAKGEIIVITYSLIECNKLLLQHIPSVQQSHWRYKAHMSNKLPVSLVSLVPFKELLIAKAAY